MSENQIFILMAIAALVMIAGVLLFTRSRRKETKALTPLAGLAFACIVGGIVFGEERWLGYGLIGAGVVLSIIDAILNSKKRV